MVIGYRQLAIVMVNILLGSPSDVVYAKACCNISKFHEPTALVSTLHELKRGVMLSAPVVRCCFLFLGVELILVMNYE